MKITIETLSDCYDCDTCGFSDAYGAIVYFDDELAIDLTPVAHCYSGQSYDDSEIFTKVLNKLGHEVEIK